MVFDSRKLSSGEGLHSKSPLQPCPATIRTQLSHLWLQAEKLARAPTAVLCFEAKTMLWQTAPSPWPSLAGSSCHSWEAQGFSVVRTSLPVSLELHLRLGCYLPGLRFSPHFFSQSLSPNKSLAHWIPSCHQLLGWLRVTLPSLRDSMRTTWSGSKLGVCLRVLGLDQWADWFC